MKNLYFNSIAKKLKHVAVMLAILSGVSTSVNAQVKKAFTQRTSQYSPTKKIYNVKGDFTMLGNTNLTPQNYGNTTNNNDESMVFVDVDGDSSTFNSSTATLAIPTENGSVASCSNIVFAGLYWTGRSSSSNVFNVTKGNVTRSFNKRVVKLKGPNATSYTEITAGTNDIYYPTNSDDYIFSAYAEVTDYVRTNGIGAYTVADLALLQGNPGGTGYSGGWAMVVVYENTKMKWRDVTIFDGYAYVESGNSSSGIQLPVSGFNSAISGNVGMKIGVIASEGDVGYTGDYFRIRNLQSATYTTLSRNANGNVPNPDNFFNSSINAPGARNPNLQNNTGIDIGIINIPNTNNSVIGNNQTETRFLYGTNGDTYSIFTIAMSVDAYVPEAEAIITTTTINNQPAVQPYTILPNQDAGFSIDVRNLGTEAINNYKVVVPVPYNATYVAGSATGTIYYTNPNTTITGTYDPTLGATGSIVWNFGTLPLPANPSTLLARLTFKLKSTTDCEILANATCSSVIGITGNSVGVGATTNVALNNSNLIQGYTQNGTCVGQAIPTPINIGINGTSYVQQNCPGTDFVRHFSYCSSSTSVKPSEIASNFPTGSLFYNSFPVTLNSVQFTESNPIPLVAGSTVTYYAIPPGGGSGCNFPFTVAKCPAIIAQDDALAGGNGTTGNANAGNVLNNNGSGADTLNGVQATISQVNITVTTPATSIGGAPVPVLNPTTGVVSVPPGTPAGTYTIVYNLCEKLNPATNCDPATVTITVTKPAIIAQDDTLSGGNGTAGNPNAGNVLNNNGNGFDTLNGANAVISLVNISVTTPATSIGGAPVPVLDVATGQVSVPAGTAAGTYTIVYNLCEKLNPTNCDPATVTITVTRPVIIAQDDTLSGGNGTAGNPNAGNVLNNNGNGNDTLNGNNALITQVNITVTTPAVSIGGAPVPVLAPATGQVSVPAGTPAGTYTIVYNLCEKLNPTNCDPATVTITVTAPAIIAQDDTLSGGNGTTGNPNAGNVLNNNGNGNDTLNGSNATISQVNISVTTPAVSIGGAPVPVLNPTTGQVSVPAGTAAGTYTIVYNLCEKLNPTNCDPATVTITVTAPAIIAQDDTLSGGNGTTGNPNAGNVLNNNGNGFDTLNGSNATIALVNISVTTPAVSIGGAPVPTLDVATGQVSVPAGTPAGTYTIVYNLCEKLNPTNCDPATVTITVTKPAIIAQDDTLLGGNGTTGNPIAGNILNDNGNGADTLNGVPALLAQVNISVTTPAVSIGGAPVPVLNTTTGIVSVPAGTPAGTYTITYNLCEKLNPTNCDPAIITITVTAPAIIAQDDTLSGGNGTTGNPNAGNVLNNNGNGNDTLNGSNATIALVNISVTTPAVSIGGAPVPVLNPITGVVSVPAGTPAGTYTIVYNLCEKLNPTNCDPATVTITVTKPLIIAQDDTLSGGNGTTGNPNAGNVLNNNGNGNDTLNGSNATIALVNISVTTPAVSIGGAPVPVLNPITGVVSVPAGTPAGTYTIVYNLCEKLNPTNCDPATVTITVTAPAIIAQDDTLSGGNGTTGNPNAGNVLNNNGNGNDTLNGSNATIALVNISVTTPAVSIGGAPVPTLDVATGVVSVPTGTPAGTYTIVYNLCEKLNPTNCDPATVTITVTAPAIIAQDDTLSGGNGTTGNPNAGNVLNNNGNGPDTLNGNPVTIAQVNIAVTTPAVSIGGAPVPTLDVATGVVSVPAGTPAGTYTIVYNLCEKLNPTNCDPATVTITVTAPAIIAQDDTLSGGNGITGNPNAGNVLNNNGNGNDTLNGNNVLISQVNISVTTPATSIGGGPVPTLDVATGVVSVPAGTPAGTYTIVYNLCEKLNPTNCDPATVTITVYTPSIELLKNGTYVDSLAPAGVSVGDTIVYNFTVTNTGGAPLTNITVTDPLVTVVGGPLATLAVGASDTTTFTAVYTINQADIDAGQVNNLATATGTPPTGPVVTDTSSDPTPCTTCNPVPNCPTCTTTPLPQTPSIAITKDGTYADTTAPFGVTNVGDTVTYAFVITNTGNVTLTNITVTDNNATVSGGPLATLAPGASNSTTFTAVHVITQADIDAGVVFNLATATGTPPTGAPVTGTSTDPTPCTTCPSNPQCPTCTGTPLTPSPSIAITKDGTYADTTAPFGVTNPGDVVNYAFVITNTGNVTLTNITVTDNNATVVGGPLASLAPGASNSTTFTAVHVITQADIDAGVVFNLATATGTPPTGTPVTGTSTDPTPCTTCPSNPTCPTCTGTPLTPSPSIAITKDGTYADTTAPFGVTNPGDVVNYAFVITNTGNVTLTNITVTDNNATVVGGPLASLAPGASNSTTFTAVHVITQADIDAGVVFNLATATGNPPTGNPVTGTSTDPTPCTTCPSNPTCPTCTGTPLTPTPSIAITKDGTYQDTTAPIGVINPGDVVTYAFVVTNTGNVTLTNITVTDNNATVTGGPLASLAPGASNSTTFTAVHVITQADIDAGVVFNLATATGTPPTGTPVTGTSTDPTPCTTCPTNPQCPTCTATPLTPTPSIAITKDGTFVDSTAPFGETNVGDTVTYAFVVTNTGNVTLTNITVTDNNATVTGGPLATLAPGASNATTFTAVHVITQADIDAGVVFNLALATGTPPTGTPVTGTSTDPTPCTNCPTNPTCPTCTATPLIKAVDDVFSGVACNVTAITGNILSNDTLGGAPVNTSATTQVTLTILTGNYPNISIAPNGDINFTTGVAAGSYTYTYQICNVALPNVCDKGTVTINVVDNTPPVVTPASNSTVQCDGNGNAAALAAWLAANGGATATDSCSAITWTNNFAGLSDGCGNTGSATVTFTAADDSGNTTPTTATFTIIDDVAPTITTAAANSTVQCDGNGNTAALTAWLASNGGAVASDVCSNVTWSNNFTALSDGCGSTGSATVIFTAKDDCNNEATTTATFTIEDTAAPTFTAPANIEIFTSATCTYDASIAITGDVTNEADNCSTGLQATFTDSVAEGACAGSKVITRTWTLVDACNNAAAPQVQTITVTDNIAPTFTAPANIEIFTTATCTYDASVTATGDVTNEADNCSTGLQATFTDSIANGTCPGSKVITRTWTLVDGCNNAAAPQVQTITVTDNIAPTFTAPADITISTAANCTYDASVAITGDVTNEADNCSTGLQATFTDSVADGTCPGSKVITRTWTLVDACNNAAAPQVQTITVRDNTAPTFTAPANIEIFTTANCTYDASIAITGDVTNEADNCSTGLQATFTDSVAEGACAGSKVITRTWTLVDACNNAAAPQVQTITVTDNIAPTFTAPANIEIFTTATCTYDASVTATGDVTNEADNCSTGLQATFTDSIANGTCPGSKVITRTWTLVDACNNAAAPQVQTITVTDNIAPTFTAPANIEIFTSATCTYDASVAITGDVTNEADNCSTGLQATFTDSVADGTCPGSKVITRTWTLVDGCNNAAAPQVQTITVRDNTAPTFTAPANIEIFTTANCTYDASIAITGDVTNEADNCSTGLQATFTDSVAEGACAGSKVITRTWTLVDACNNAAAPQVQTITVRDNTAPTFTAPANIEIFTTATCTYDASIAITGDVTNEADNCSTGLQATFTDSVANGACAGSKVITRTWTLVDACNNAAAPQVQTITVTDNIAPTFTAPADITIATAADCTYDASVAITGDVTNEADNCSTGLQATFTDSIANGTCAGSKVITRTWTLVDACNNAAAPQVQTITVIDNTAPVVPAAPAPTVASCITQIPAMISLTATDNCSGAITVQGVDTVAAGSCPNSFIVTRTWTFVDACNNSSSVSQTITVNDNIAPTFDQAAPADAPASCDNIPAPAVLTATDNCGTATVTMTETTLAGSCAGNYTIVRTWIATDACGNNSAPVTQNITVTDTTGPVVVGNFDAKLHVNCTEIPAVPALQFTDNCSAVGTPTFTETQTAPVDGIYTITRTWLVADACGNVSPYTQIIYVTEVTQVTEVKTRGCINEDLAYTLRDLLPNPALVPANAVWVNEDNAPIGFNGTTFNAFGNPLGVYTFSYTILGGACPVKIEIKMTIDTDCTPLPCATVVIHNAFTPNGDGINEFFHIENIEDFDCYPANKVEIYNRWGVLVYETNNYDNNSKRFEGISEGRATLDKSAELPTGTYFYIIQWKTAEGNIVNKDGYLYLTR